MPVILAKWSGRPSIEVASGASNYRLMFLEAKVDAKVYHSTHASLIAIGDGSSAQNTIASQPKNIIVDRVLMRGSDNPPVDLYRGIDLECQYCAVANSWIDQVHVRGFDSQGIVGWNSTGPWLIDNNYIEAAAENIMLCGSDSHIPGALPSDITITHNYVFKPLNWKWPSQTTGEAGPNWAIKNLLEMKCGIRVLIEGNVFQNVWLGQSDQLGEAIKINPANQKNAPWTGVSDLTFRLNEVINAEGGFGGPTCSTGPNPTRGNQRDLFENNLSIATGGASGRRILVTGTSNGNTCGMPDVYFNHNTILASSDFALTMITMESIVPAGVVPLQRFAFHNNIMAYDSRVGCRRQFDGVLCERCPPTVLDARCLVVGHHLRYHDSHVRQQEFRPARGGLPGWRNRHRGLCESGREATDSHLGPEQHWQVCRYRREGCGRRHGRARCRHRGGSWSVAHRAASFSRHRLPPVFDGRNLLDPHKIKALECECHAVGGPD